MEEILGLSEPQGYKKPIMSAGEEFVSWAEQYWRLKEKYSQHVNNQYSVWEEQCPYDVVKLAFINQINFIIEKRVEHYL